MSPALANSLDFALPDGLAAHQPPEVRGSGRDDVRLMISHAQADIIEHKRFCNLPEFLAAGDVLVVNTSATINAAFNAVRENGEHLRLHLSTPLNEDVWVVELRRMSAKGSLPLHDAVAGERIALPGHGTAALMSAFSGVAETGVRLWRARLTLSSDVLGFCDRFGFPIRYSYVPHRWPLSYYQTVFAVEPGSAEMPSAGRPFSWQLIQRLSVKGVRITPVVLHTGVASLEAGEDPYPERFRVTREAANAVNTARADGRKVIAVGTTVVRALESVASENGRVQAGQGWTDLVITRERGVRAVDALLTGLHAPRASHLSMLAAFTGYEQLARAYDEAIERGYLWHEFGDVHLILKH